MSGWAYSSFQRCTFGKHLGALPGLFFAATRRLWLFVLRNPSFLRPMPLKTVIWFTYIYIYWFTQHILVFKNVDKEVSRSIKFSISLFLEASLRLVINKKAIPRHPSFSNPIMASFPNPIRFSIPFHANSVLFLNSKGSIGHSRERKEI